MTTESRPEISQERRNALGTDLRALEFDNLAEIRANYHNFAEAVKPILKQGAAKLITHGIFPEKDVAIGTLEDCRGKKILDIGHEAERSLSLVVVDAEGKMYICEQIRAGRGLGWIIDWASRTEAEDQDYVDFSLIALREMADQFREALDLPTQENPIPDNSRW